MNEKIQNACNEQIREELNSAYIYLGMSAYFKGQNLPGFANWFFVQGQEEFDHAMGFYNFVFDRGGQAELKALDEARVDYSNALEAGEETLKHEKYITSKINDLYELAREEKDYAFESFLKWYIDEQVEEEDSAQNLIDKFKMIGSEGQALYLLDKEMGARVYKRSSILGKE